MKKPLVSVKRAQALSTALLLASFAVLILTRSFWPGLVIAIGLPLALKQFLLERKRDALFTLLIFVGFFITAQFKLSWKILIPILFTLTAIYILCREWVEGSAPKTEIETDRDLNQEIEEDTKPPKSS